MTCDKCKDEIRTKNNANIVYTQHKKGAESRNFYFDICENCKPMILNFLTDETRR